MDNYVVGTTSSERALFIDNPNIKTGDDLLNKIAVGAYCSSQNVVFVSSTDKVLQVIKTLQEHHIQSVPVRDAKKMSYNSFIDSLDILVHILNTSERAIKENLSDDAAQEAFSSLTAHELANLSKRDPFSPVGVDTPTKIALDKFVRWKAHRLPVLGGDGQLEMVLSQMGALEFLQKHVGLFDVSNKTVGSLKLGYKPVCSVTEGDTVKRAFSLIVEMNISGLAVVDDKGVAIGGISTSDAKQLLTKEGKLDLKMLEMPIKDYKEMVHKEGGMVAGAMQVHPDATVEEVCLKFVVSKVHRLFVVDNDNIVGIISIIDILSCLNPQ